VIDLAGLRRARIPAVDKPPINLLLPPETVGGPANPRPSIF
jgi:hypothetical protein